MKILIGLILLCSMSMAEAAGRAMLVVSSSSEIDVIYKTTKLPYNILLSNSPKCYAGQIEQVKEILTKMVSNHRYSSGISMSNIRQSSSEGDIYVTFTARSYDIEVSFSKCNVE